MKVLIFCFGPLQTNAFAILCEKTHTAAVIDPSYGSSASILEALNGYTIEKILLTHSHWDHIADAKKLKDRTGAKIFVHKLDAYNLESPGSDGIPMMVSMEGVSPDGFLKDGQKIEVGALSLSVIHTPGHSPGSVCFYLPEHKVLISGDTLFKGTYGSLSLPTAEPEKMPASLEKLGKLPKETRVFPGHGEATTIENERRFVCRS